MPTKHLRMAYKLEDVRAFDATPSDEDQELVHQSLVGMHGEVSEHWAALNEACKGSEPPALKQEAAEETPSEPAPSEAGGSA